MAGSFNKVILLGNLTRDPELRHTSSNQAVATIGLAVNRRWRDQSGEMREDVVFVDCDAWGKTAETLCKFLTKGRPIFIEGRLKLDQWQDKEGNKRSKLGVVIENFQFVDSREGGGDGGGGKRGASSDDVGGGGARGRSAPTHNQPQGSAEFSDDDIPF